MEPAQFSHYHAIRWREGRGSVLVVRQQGDHVGVEFSRVVLMSKRLYGFKSVRSDWLVRSQSEANLRQDLSIAALKEADFSPNLRYEIGGICPDQAYISLFLCFI